MWYEAQKSARKSMEARLHGFVGTNLTSVYPGSRVLDQQWLQQGVCSLNPSKSNSIFQKANMMFFCVLRLCVRLKKIEDIWAENGVQEEKCLPSQWKPWVIIHCCQINNWSLSTVWKCLLRPIASTLTFPQFENICWAVWGGWNSRSLSDRWMFAWIFLTGGFWKKIS
jgi:hypothetical protein